MTDLAEEKPKILFISWSGSQAKAIAQGLKEIYRVLPLDIFISPDIPAGTSWPEEIKDNLNGATYGLGIITDHSLSSPWVMFEAGWLKGKLDNFMMLTFDTEIPSNSPLRTTNTKDGADFANIVGLALRMAQPLVKPQVLDALKESLNTKPKAAAWAELLEASKPALPTGIRKRLRISMDMILQSLLSASDPEIRENPSFQEIICKSVENLGDIVRSLAHHPIRERTLFRLQRKHYPELLIHLQKDLNCQVRAVAIVEKVEEFWSESLGTRIAENADKQSERIFVFKNPDDLKRYWHSILMHSRKYRVFVTSLDMLTWNCRPYDVDFSIITHPQSGSRLLAKYDETSLCIEFGISKEETAVHERIINRLILKSERIDPSAAKSAAGNHLEALALRIFPDAADKEPFIQMSKKISAEKYDLYEEDHPFFKEMMACMLEEMKVSRRGMEVSTLELGAGTGHFTKRIAQLPIDGLKILAVEYDKYCFTILRNKLSLDHKVKLELADSVTYNPPGEFDFIFSSFAEHHITPDQKTAYLTNVRNNLKPEGRFIVGDEFLRPHDRRKEEEHIAALNAYHGYIIDLAEKDGHHGVASLERDALNSGKEGSVDFKISLADYEKHLQAAGLVCEKRIRITPAGTEAEIGGIYVLVIRTGH